MRTVFPSSEMDLRRATDLSEPLVLQGAFRILDYFASHSQLLIRCSDVHEQGCRNTDLRFYGVKYTDLPTYFENPIVRLGSEADLAYVASRVPQPFHYASLFVVESQTHRYFIMAAGLEVSRNELELLESSLTRW